jgi:hypothetical protein
MNNENITKIIIIGSGWYGCHIASILKDKYDVTIIEKNSDIFDNSSYYNQNRLHLGFHYCRNYPTRNLCQQKYETFLKKYENVVHYIDNNYYVISKDSILDYQTFISIYKHEDFDFEIIENNIFDNIDGKIIKVKENVINSAKSKDYFKGELRNIKKIFNTKVINYTKNNNKIFVETENKDIFECDLLLDCTYNQFGLSKNNYIYENTISLLFKKNKNCHFDALTIMDGNFSSLYPRDISNNIYTLTDVEFTPLVKSKNYKDIEDYQICEKNIMDTKNKMVNKLQQYYPDFQKYFEYDGYFLSKKTKQLSSSDSRDIIIEEIEKNVISVNCGKIYGIFDWEDYIKKYLCIEI